MTDAPERIWATMMDQEFARSGTFVDCAEYPSRPNSDAEMYCHAAAIAELVEGLRDVIEACDRLGVAGGNIPRLRALIAKHEDKT